MGTWPRYCPWGDTSQDSREQGTQRKHSLIRGQPTRGRYHPAWDYKGQHKTPRLRAGCHRNLVRAEAGLGEPLGQELRKSLPVAEPTESPKAQDAPCPLMSVNVTALNAVGK